MLLISDFENLLSMCNFTIQQSFPITRREIKPTGQITRSDNLNCRSCGGVEISTSTKVWFQLIVQSSLGKEINWKAKHIKNQLKLALACYEIIGSPKDWEVYFCFVYKWKLKSTTSALSLKISKLGSIFCWLTKVNLE